MLLEIVSPDEKIFKGEVNSVTLPGTEGSFQILKNHAPIVSSLALGKVVYKIDETTKEVEIKGGVVEVNNDKVIVLAD